MACPPVGCTGTFARENVFFSTWASGEEFVRPLEAARLPTLAYTGFSMRMDSSRMIEVGMDTDEQRQQIGSESSTEHTQKIGGLAGGEAISAAETGPPPASVARAGFGALRDDPDTRAASPASFGTNDEKNTTRKLG
ncbi:hypothetical protein CTRI78_v008835 [Colletotrichum trifolii]|uniref:Uncharacterized protein n=1 Tax=Colletotrichum trifolii TaxID=5466 RepID=A0A4R8QS75_COLTR|nr:hypothetical protein CTRI78_v008835 [Colletotrichum trifolii]